MLSQLLHSVPLLLSLSCILAVRGYHQPDSDKGGDSLAGLAGRDLRPTPGPTHYVRTLEDVLTRSYDDDDDNDNNDDDDGSTTPTPVPHTLMKRGSGCQRCSESGQNSESQQTSAGKKNPKPKPKPKKKKFRGIDFSRQRQHRFVRFILASSVDTPATNGSCVPVVIDTPNCYDVLSQGKSLNNPDDFDATYGTRGLQTRDLQADPNNARNCQSYGMVDAGGARMNLTRYNGYPIGVRISNDSNSQIGWDHDGDQPVKWVKQFDPTSLNGKISMDCEYWWSKETGGPQWHAKSCLMKLVTAAGQNTCIAADRVDPGTGKPLLYQPCDRKNPSQVWHLQATALEMPFYGGNCGQACWGLQYNQNPLQFWSNGTVPLQAPLRPTTTLTTGSGSTRV